MKYVFINWEIDQAYVLLEHGVKGGGNRGQYTDVRRYVDHIIFWTNLNNIWNDITQILSYFKSFFFSVFILSCPQIRST